MSTPIPSKIQARTRSGASFYIEVEEASSESETSSRQAQAAETSASGGDAGLAPSGTAQGAADEVLKADLFARAVEVIKDVSQDVSSSLMQTKPAPSQVQLSLELGFDASGSVWILKGGAKASMRLVLTWSLPQI